MKWRCSLWGMTASDRSSLCVWDAGFACQPQGFQPLPVLMEGLLCSLMLCHGFGGIRLFEYLASLALSRRNYLSFKCVTHPQLDPYVRTLPLRISFSATSS